MSPTDSETYATDGGRSPEVNELNLFTQTADVPERTYRENLARQFDLYIRAPFTVAWKDVRTRIGSLLLLGFFLTGTLGVRLVEMPTAMAGPIFQVPFQSLKYPLGTDNLGRGLLEILILSTPAMIKMVAAGALLSVVVGTFIGTIAGYIGGWTDRVMMTLADVVLTLPALPLIIVLAAVYTPESPYIVGIILGIDNWPGLSRTLRSQVLSLREESFAEASRAMGLKKRTILRMDIITNLMPYILVNLANSSRKIIFESVALYYLGILPFTTLNWGVMLNTAYQSGQMTDLSKVHWIIFPMIAIILVSLGFMLFAQGMDRVFNVRLRAKYAKTQDSEGNDPVS